MNQQQRKEMYPLISYNNKQRCEQRWEDDANIYDDVGTEWEISIGNGKRLRQKWKRKSGIAYVPNRYGEIQTIYNKVYDVEWQKAKYDRSYQPDDEPDFYSSPGYILRNY